MVDHVPQLYLMQAVVAQQLDGFIKFPPRQKPASFNLDSVLAHGGEATQLKFGFKVIDTKGARWARPFNRVNLTLSANDLREIVNVDSRLDLHVDLHRCALSLPRRLNSSRLRGRSR